jgi:hypothetical protein
MLLRFFCPGTIQVASCLVSSQLISLAAVSSGSGGVVPPVQPLYKGTYTILCQGPRVFTLQVEQREEIITVSHLKCAWPWMPCLAAPDAAADRWAQARLPPLTQVV